MSWRICAWVLLWLAMGCRPRSAAVQAERVPPPVQTIVGDDGCPHVLYEPPGASMGLRLRGRPLTDGRLVGIELTRGPKSGPCRIEWFSGDAPVELVAVRSGVPATITPAVALEDLTQGLEARSLSGRTCGRAWRMFTREYHALGEFVTRFDALARLQATRGGSICGDRPAAPTDAGTGRDTVADAGPPQDAGHDP